MRTNRPEGIFQGNRTEPLFILLRHYADEQKEEAMKLVKEFIIFTLAQVIVGIIPLILAILYPRTIIAAAMVTVVVAAVSIVNYYYLRNQLNDLTQKEVDRLLQSDEYRYSTINGEELFNKAAHTLRKTGALMELRRFHWLCFLFVAFFVFMTILHQMEFIVGG